jgi:type IV secretion system protein VirB5
MFTRRHRWGLLGLVVLWAAAPLAHAQFAVVDVGAIAQMVKQIATLEQQLSTAQSQLAQAQTQLAAESGGRGMENLLSGTPRNYLPSSWDQLQSATQGTSSSYGSFGTSIQSLVTANAVLSPQQTAALSPAQLTLLTAARQNAALAQAISRTALANNSQRFGSIQQLISAIPTAKDQKGVLDLNTRIAAEQVMAQNEQSKLATLSQLIQAQERAREQQLREQAIADVGSFRNLPPMGL